MKPLPALFRSVAAAMVFVVLTATAATPAWKPDQTVELIVPTSPGGGSDSTARVMQNLMQDRKLVERAVSVVNKPGGGGTIGLIYLTQQAGSGRHLMVTSPTMLTNHIMGKTQITYRDLTPLAVIGADFIAFSVRADSPIKTGADLVARLKKDATSVTFALANALGNHNHIAIGEVARAVGADIRNLKVVVFNSSGPATTALLGGHVDVTATPASQMMSQAEGGKLRNIAVSAEQRLSGGLSAIPTWKEQGVSAVSANWRNIVGPKGMTDAQIRYWDTVIGQLVQLPEWKKYMDSTAIENTYLDSAGTRKQLDSLYKDLTVTLAGFGLAK